VRATRAYLAGLGTAGSIVVGAALVFVLASAVVAFRGWPGADGLETPAQIVLSAPARSERPVARRLAVLVDSSRSADVGAASRTPVATVVNPRRPAGVAAGGGGSPTLSIGESPRTQPVGSPSTQPTQPAPTTGPTRSLTPTTPGRATTTPAPPTTLPTSGGDTGDRGTVGTVLKNATGTVGGTVSGTGAGVGTIVKKVTAPVGGPISSVGSGAGDTITKVTGGVGDVISKTGSGLGSTTGGVTGSVGGLLGGS
jgi:hypothetical protein